MTKEDYMKLSKERLAELLEERDSIQFIPYYPLPHQAITPCYAPDGICLNPQMDCINCPKHSLVRTITNTTIGTK